jgi:DNA mismatch repair protein MSH5
MSRSNIATLIIEQVGCIGAILAYIQRRKSAEFLPGDEAASVSFRIRSFEMFSLANMLFVNADTLASLQILQSESHPNSHNQGPTKSTSGAKESLSVYGLFQHLALTPQGRHKLRQMFLRPSMDLHVIEERQATISTLLRPENTPALEKLIHSLRKIKNMRTVLINLQKGVSGTSAKGSLQNCVWASLQYFSYTSLKIVEAAHELVDGQSLEVISRV